MPQLEYTQEFLVAQVIENFDKNNDKKRGWDGEISVPGPPTQFVNPNDNDKLIQIGVNKEKGEKWQNGKRKIRELDQ